MSNVGGIPRRYPGIRLEAIALLGVALLYASLANSQPILENYVGRQVPTAMVARNLDRGWGFLRPQLDTGPFPNLFLVEPPIYGAIVVLVKRATGLPLDRCGRLVSGVGMMLACWGLAGLVRRRPDGPPAWMAIVALAFLPVSIRFGRAFQPDALAIGLVLAGSRAWDDFEEFGGRTRLVIAWALLAVGLATKVLMAFALVPLIVAVLRSRRASAFSSSRKILLALSTLLPALLWYAYAAWVMAHEGGSRASADNASLWLAAISLAPWRNVATYRTVARMLGWRAFGTVGLWVAIVGFFRPWPSGRYWRWWAISASAMLIVVGGKLHHEYYFLAIAPVVAVGIALAVSRFIIVRPGARSRAVAALMLACVLILVVSMWQVRDRTRQTPPEWAAWPLAVDAIRNDVPPGTLLAAPEAILYLADRKGCRLEYEPKARLRAAGEWGATIDPSDPLALVELYRSKGAEFVCDLWPVADEPDRRALHDAIRRRYNVLIDRDGVILAALVDRE